jgi:hypothetical protein
MWCDAREESEAWKPKVLWEETLMGAVDDAAIGDWVKDRRRALSRWKMESKLFEIVLIIFIDSEARATVCHQWDIPTGHGRVNGSTAKHSVQVKTHVKESSSLSPFWDESVNRFMPPKPGIGKTPRKY